MPPDFKDAFKSSSPREILRQVLKDSLTDRVDACNFCADKWEELYPDVRDMQFSQILTEIIVYCQARSREHELWQWIRERNPARYDEWFDKWEAAVKLHRRRGPDSSEAEGEDDLANGAKEDSSFSAFVGQKIKRVERSRDVIIEQGEDSKRSGAAVLADGDRDAIRDWFFSELIPKERAMVLAAALFQGINRHYLSELTAEIEEIFFADEAGPATEEKPA